MATRLKVELCRRDMVIRNLSEAVGMNRMHINLIVLGKRSCREGLAEKISDTLGIPVEELFEVRMTGRWNSNRTLWARKEHLERQNANR